MRSADRRNAFLRRRSYTNQINGSEPVIIFNNFMEEIIMLKKFLADENGQGMVEYGLILALVAVVVIVAIRALGKNVSEKIEAVNTELTKTT